MYNIKLNDEQINIVLRALSNESMNDEDEGYSYYDCYEDINKQIEDIMA